MHEEMWRWLNSGIACRAFGFPICYLKSCGLKAPKYNMLPVVLYGCGTWSLTLTEQTQPEGVR
jgi:hypothetical protein